MRKASVIRSAAIAFTALLTISAAACGDGGAPSSGAPAGQDKAAGLAAEKGRKLTFMLPAFDYQDDSKFENQVLKTFKETYPEIELELITASIDNWMVKLRTSASSGEPIDVFQDSANNNPLYALRGINQPLQDYIDMSNPNLHKETMDTVFCYNGNYYVAVTEPDPCVLFYNKDIFESEGLESPEDLYKAGNWNFDSMARIAKQLTYNNNSRQAVGPRLQLSLHLLRGERHLYGQTGQGLQIHPEHHRSQPAEIPGSDSGRLVYQPMGRLGKLPLVLFLQRHRRPCLQISNGWNRTS